MQLQRESMSPFVMQRKLNNRNAIREGEERLASGDGIKLLQFHGEKAKLLRSVVFKTRQKIVQLTVKVGSLFPACLVTWQLFW
jgi:hypothetical protein